MVCDQNIIERELRELIESDRNIDAPTSCYQYKLKWKLLNKLHEEQNESVEDRYYVSLNFFFIILIN